MNHFVKGFGMALVFSATAFAAGKTAKQEYKNLHIPEIQEASFNDPEFMQERKEWSKLKRKLASNMAFNGGDLSNDLQKLREEWLKCKNGDEVEALLKKSYQNYNSYSEDAKYFLAQMHTALPFRGIVWRLRPLFENSKGFLGNKSTHVTAVQAVRGSITALKMLLPTKQTDAAIQYFTEPSVEMSKADQFQTVAEFQNFMMEKFTPILKDSIVKLEGMTKGSSQKVFVWDNKMAFGRATFEDDIQRYVGNGPAELHFVIAAMYRAHHDILVYCAYNMDHSIKIAGEMGSHLGVDSTIFRSRKEDLGLTDKERIEILKKASQKNRFLELRNYEGSNYGSNLMKVAYKSLKNSVVYFERSYQYLQGRDSSGAMGMNPVLFQPELNPNLEKGIKNMQAVVSGVSEVRDPVTGDTVTINLPAFYNNPPANLSVLMASGFEDGQIQKSIKNKSGETLVVRNYLHGRSIAWDNSAWKQYVPSAEGKSAGYMAEAHRVIQYSFGTSMVFGLPEIFVQ